MYDLIVSIVTHNSKIDILKNLIECINQEKRINIFTLIIDNLSEEKYFNKLIDLNSFVISAGKNIGYGSAHNLSNKISKESKYFLVINPDIKLEKNTLFDCYQFMETNLSYVAVTPLLKDYNGNIYKIENRSFSFFELFKRRFLKDKTLIEYSSNYYSKNIINHNFLSGAFMFIRRNSINSIGGFDERFFMYFEDIDLSIRLSDIGKLGVITSMFIIHKRSRSSYKSIKMMIIHLISFFKFKLKYRS